MTTTMNESGISAATLEKFRTVLSKHTIGEIKQDSSGIENALNVAFSNLSKITAQVAQEALLQYFNDKGKITDIKNIVPDADKLIAAVTNLERTEISIKVLDARWASFSDEWRTDSATKSAYQQYTQKLNNNLDASKNYIKTYADTYGLNINPDVDSKESILDKAIGEGFGQKFYKALNKVFNYANILELIYDAIFGDLSNETDALDFTNNLLNLMPKLSGTAFIEGSAGYIAGNSTISKLLSNVINIETAENFLVKQLPTISAKGLVGMLSRGVIVGIATELAYQGGYKFGTWLWDTLGVYDSDWYLKSSEWICQNILGMQSMEEIEATYTVSFLLSSTFKNNSNKMLTYETLGTL